MIQEQVKVEPIPPKGQKLGGHHWLQEVDFDGRVMDTVVLQWNPGAQRWSHSGHVGTGVYVDTKGWKYLAPCPMPGEFTGRETMPTREFSLMHDVQGGFAAIDGICQFLYKDYMISISTAGMSQGACHTPICIFDRRDTDKVIKDGFNTVQEAIDWINMPDREDWINNPDSYVLTTHR